jgi:hypothetical protein
MWWVICLHLLIQPLPYTHILLPVCEIRGDVAGGPVAERAEGDVEAVGEGVQDGGRRLCGWGWLLVCLFVDVEVVGRGWRVIVYEEGIAITSHINPLPPHLNPPPPTHTQTKQKNKHPHPPTHLHLRKPLPIAQRHRGQAAAPNAPPNHRPRRKRQSRRERRIDILPPPPQPQRDPHVRGQGRDGRAHCGGGGDGGGWGFSGLGLGGGGLVGQESVGGELQRGAEGACLIVCVCVCVC